MHASVKAVPIPSPRYATTEERLRYYPQYGEQIFDLTFGKMVLCIDPEKRKWVDFNGGEV